MINNFTTRGLNSHESFLFQSPAKASGEPETVHTEQQDQVNEGFLRLARQVSDKQSFDKSLSQLNESRQLMLFYSGMTYIASFKLLPSTRKEHSNNRLFRQAQCQVQQL